MVNREVQFDFYRVYAHVADHKPAVDFAALLRLTWDNREDHAAVKMRGAHYFLHLCEFRPTVIAGNLLRVRTTDIPVKASVRDKLVEGLNLAADQGVGEETAFMYKPATRLLMLQRSRMGVTRAAFADYFHRASNLDGVLELRPCVDANALARLSGMKTMRRLQISVSPTDSNRFLQGQGFSTRMVAKFAKYFAAPTVEIGLTMGRGGKKSLANVAHEIGSLLGVAEVGEITKLSVTGQMSDGDSDLIDLVHERIAYEHICPVDQEHRRVMYPARRDAMHAGFKARAKQLGALTE